ncbi:MAG TPA: leucyl aminopeptidase [Pirellulales bacterium]|jgi:leucyl aminopeptidase
MQVTAIGESNFAAVDADALALGIYAGGALSVAGREVDTVTGGMVSKLLAQKEFVGKANELLSVVAPTGLKARLLLLVGLGTAGQADTGSAYRAAAAAAMALASKERKHVAFALDPEWPADLVESGVAGVIAGSQGQDLYRAEKKRFPFTTLLWAGKLPAAVATGQILGDSINLTRRLVNEPADVMYPESFAARAAEIARHCDLEIEIWDQDRLAAERCGSLLAVARGSNQPPRLVILNYHGAKTDHPWLAIVGKGVTFDSGGLSLKPPDGMLTMKCDMAGAATMLGAMRAIALLKLPVNVVGLAGLVENMTGPAAMKLGDVLTARSGTTIEVHNTDAEGRLVLADVLNVALDRRPERIVDLATLTGACVVALGTEVAGLMTNDQPWCDAVAAAARRSGEPVWQLPMYPEIYDDMIKGEVADIKNVGEGRWGGAISAAKFLERFVGQTPWTHMDIAGPAFRDKPKPWSDGGASGMYVRTLVELVRLRGG